MHSRHSFLNTRSSRPKVLCKKSVLKNFAKFTGKNLRQSLILNKVAGLRQLFRTQLLFIDIVMRYEKGLKLVTCPFQFANMFKSVLTFAIHHLNNDDLIQGGV